MTEANPQGGSPFTKFFLPGLVLGIIIGAFAGVILTPILGGEQLPKHPASTGASGPRDDRRDEGLAAEPPATEPGTPESGERAPKSESDAPDQKSPAPAEPSPAEQPK